MVFKIGRTRQTITQRLAGYPKGTTIMYSTIVRDCIYSENIVKKLFCKLFTLREEYGSEYFEGDIFEMIEAIKTIC